MSKPLDILLIEDNPADAVLLEEFLRFQQVKMECATRLADGLSLAQSRRFDAVLSSKAWLWKPAAWRLSELKSLREVLMRNQFFFFPVVSACLMLAACQRAPERRFDLKGKVVAVDKAERQVTIAHEKIPGFMDAMTMPFNVGDDWAMSVLAPGQEVEATLVVREDRSWIENLRISKTEDMKGAAVSPPVPKPGDEVPDFQLMNQDNQRIHIRQYRGRPLLLTFVYTRCPIPDYCPRTSKNFSDLHRSLQPYKPDRRPHLLTISFDTDHDTPAVLREYAGRYMNPVRFEDWEFATGSPDEIKKITGYFGLTYWPEANQITHSLVTALIGPNGRIERVYQGNQWTPGQILADLK